MSKHTAVLVGATGLVGKELLKVMLSKPYYDRIKVVTRRPIDQKDDRLEIIMVKSLDELEDIQDQLVAQDYYCTLGTTIKKAGSKEAFKKVDLDYPIKLAEIAQKSPDFRDYLVVTAAGSNADSPLFYNQVKGELEERLKAMNLHELKIFRPSLLRGHRDEFRLGEEVAKVISNIFSFFMVGIKRKLWSIHSEDVARAMFIVATEDVPGTKIYSSADMTKTVKTQGL